MTLPAAQIIAKAPMEAAVYEADVVVYNSIHSVAI